MQNFNPFSTRKVPKRQTKPTGVTTQMKVLHECILTVLFSFLVKRVNFSCKNKRGSKILNGIR